MVAGRAQWFVDEAPTGAVAAATIVLNGVKAARRRILVGSDAEAIDRRVRKDPEHAYDEPFFDAFAAEVGWRLQR